MGDQLVRVASAPVVTLVMVMVYFSPSIRVTVALDLDIVLETAKTAL